MAESFLTQTISNLKGRHQNKSAKNIPNFNLGIFETQGGGLDFSKMSELQTTLKPHPKKKNKTLHLALFTGNISINMSFKMTVRGGLLPPICSQIKKF